LISPVAFTMACHATGSHAGAFALMVILSAGPVRVLPAGRRSEALNR